MRRKKHDSEFVHHPWETFRSDQQHDHAQLLCMCEARMLCYCVVLRFGVYACVVYVVVVRENVLSAHPNFPLFVAH